MTEPRDPTRRVDVVDEDRAVGPVDEQSLESFPASDAPASWAGPPGSDPVVRPGGSGAWTPSGTDPTVAPVSLLLGARGVRAWRWRQEDATAVVRAAAFPLHERDGVWYLDEARSTAGAEQALPERGWLVEDGPVVLVFAEQPFVDWYDRARTTSGPAEGAPGAGGVAGEGDRGVGPETRALAAAALESGFD